MLPSFEHHEHVVHQGSSPTPEAIVKKRKQSDDYVQFGFSLIQRKEFLYPKCYLQLCFKEMNKPLLSLHVKRKHKNYKN